MAFGGYEKMSRHMSGLWGVSSSDTSFFQQRQLRRYEIFNRERSMFVPEMPLQNTSH